MLEKCFSEFNFDRDLNFPRNINARDVHDIPGYYFRDDGLKIWTAIRNYVENVTNIFYKDDHEIIEDGELQNWSSELIA